MKYTPRKWELGTHPANHKLNIVKPILFGRNVTILPECEGGHASINNIADARLIAASPDMYEALNECLRYFQEQCHGKRAGTHPKELMDLVCAAIFKAEGKES